MTSKHSELWMLRELRQLGPFHVLGQEATLACRRAEDAVPTRRRHIIAVGKVARRR